MDSQITTKRGDRGFTTALSGEYFPKSHIMMECAGTVDELRAHLALVRLSIVERGDENAVAQADFILWLLHMCFLLGSACSDPENRHPEFHPHSITEAHLDRLETHQATLEAKTPLPHAFVVSTSDLIAAQIDVACTVARRLERNIVRLKETCPAFDGGLIMAFINRLSDVLYLLARNLEHPHHVTVNYDLLDK